MDDALCGVKVVDAKTNLNENFPNKVFDERLAILLSNVCVQVSVLAVLLNNVDFGPFNK